MNNIVGVEQYLKIGEKKTLIRLNRIITQIRAIILAERDFRN